jgi:hypothetical protein
MLLNQYDPEQINSSLLTKLYQKYADNFYYAAISVFILVALLTWQITSRKPKRIYQQFRDIDSTTLDTDHHLCRDFYKTVLYYRVKFGKKKYLRYIIKHFDFFYEYHNYALGWIDEVVTRVNRQLIPENFILAAITTGHIGRVYFQAHYATGLPASNLKENAPLVFHDCADDIEIWSYQSHHALCKIKKKTVKLHTAHRHPNYISAIITGTNPGERDKVTVELRFLTRAVKKGKQRRSEAIAKHHLHEFQKWLKQVSKTKSRSNTDTGIEVSEIVNHDSIFTTPLVRHLEQLVYRKIAAYYPRAKLPLADPGIALDALVLCNGIGLIAISEKMEQGDITYSGDPTWYQFRGEDAFEIKNPCIQARLAKSSLSNLLTGHNLTRWPVVSLVVYSKNNVSLNMAIGTERLQCHVIKLNQLEKWLNKHRTNPQIQFTQNDITMFNMIMGHKQPLPTVV